MLAFGAIDRGWLPVRTGRVAGFFERPDLEAVVAGIPQVMLTTP